MKSSFSFATTNDDNNSSDKIIFAGKMKINIYTKLENYSSIIYVYQKLKPPFKCKREREKNILKKRTVCVELLCESKISERNVYKTFLLIT